MLVSLYIRLPFVVVVLLFRGIASARRLVSSSVGDGSDSGARHLLNLTGTSKEITFMRHAESAGNQGKSHPLRYLFENNFDVMAYKDGRLTEIGETHVIRRVMEMGVQLKARIVQAEVLMVSPLQRTMATAIIMLATAFVRQEIPMRIKVVADLREKVASGSDIPLDDASAVKSYLLEVANRCSQRSFGADGKYNQLVLRMFDSYLEEKRRRDNFSFDVPSDASSIFRSIRRFKGTLRQDPAQRVLVVGHNGWSRWAFAAGLPFPSDRNAVHDTKAMRLIFGARMVKPLCNVGILTVRLDGESGMFEDVKMLKSHLRELQCSGKGKLALFADSDEAIAAGQFPDGASTQRVVMQKQQDYSGFGERLITFSTAGGATYMAWATKMGTPKKYIDLSWWNVKATFDDSSRTVRVESRHSDKIETMSYTGEKSRSNAFVLAAHDENAYIIFKTAFLGYTSVANAHLVDVLRKTLGHTIDAAGDGTA